MLACISSYAPVGLEGGVVTVEVDIRRGIPGIDIIGLPDGSIREARQRVRVAIKNAGYRTPVERILVSLAPAGLRKTGALYDLPIAIGILVASQQIRWVHSKPVMVLGELNLSGRVRPVRGVLSAVGAGLRKGIETFVVPKQNQREAAALCAGNIVGVASLTEAAHAVSATDPVNLECCWKTNTETAYGPQAVSHEGDFSDIRGHRSLKRALEIAAAGKHHVLLFGPPGSGKTMAARRFPTILPDLSRADSLVVTSIYSIAGALPADHGLIVRPPFRAPHHSASCEGVVGGGHNPKPGEVSLAHRGVLFLDEAPEFRQTLLQTLREPVEEGHITIARAGSSIQYPSGFQLILAANPCPCGNLGRDNGVCICSKVEIHRYWRRLGGALLDRIDIRVPLRPVAVQTMQEGVTSDSAGMRRRVELAVKRQKQRYRTNAFCDNAKIPPGMMEEVVRMKPDLHDELRKATADLALSSRAYHSVLKIARTIADLEDVAVVRREHVLEAVAYRRYGDGDIFWSYA